MNGLLSLFRSTFTKEELREGGTLENNIKDMQRAMKVILIDHFRMITDVIKAIVPSRQGIQL